MQESVRNHNRAVLEAKQQASDALEHERKQHKRELERCAAEMTLVRKQARDCQQNSVGKEVQLSDVQSRLDTSTVMLERLQSGQETARKPQQSKSHTQQSKSTAEEEQAAKDARIAELDSQLKAALSYRKKFLALEHECKQQRGAGSF